MHNIGPLSDPDAAKADRVTRALWQITKIDIRQRQLAHAEG